METIVKGVVELISLNLETYRPHYDRLSEKQKSEFKKLEECRAMLLPPPGAIKLPVSNVKNNV